MASEAILKQKQVVIDEIKGRVEAAKTIVLFDYRGITDSEAKELRCKLRETNSLKLLACILQNIAHKQMVQKQRKATEEKR